MLSLHVSPVRLPDCPSPLEPQTPRLSAGGGGATRRPGIFGWEENGGLLSQVDELLDVVDAADNVVGQQPRSEVYRLGLLCRVVNAFLENTQGQLWIPRRTARKRTFPLCLDMSMGGHVESGESYEEALTRELLEELRMDANQVNLELLGYLTPQGSGVSAFMKVYRIRTDDAPEYNKDDFLEAQWLLPGELARRLREGEPAKGDLLTLIERFYTGKKQYGRAKSF